MSNVSSIFKRKYKPNLTNRFILDTQVFAEDLNWIGKLESPTFWTLTFESRKGICQENVTEVTDNGKSHS